MTQPDARVQNLVRPAGPEPPHLAGVIVLFDPGLNGLPVAESAGSAPEPMQEGGARDGLADAGIRARYEDAAQSPISFSAEARAAANRSSTASESPALTAMRRRAVPAGTLGGRIARTSKPSL
jgi:hypothetical protein